MKKEEILIQADLFRNISDDGRSALAGICLEKNLKKKEILFLEGDEGDALYMLVEGSIQLYKSNPEGKEIVIKVVKPGELFAEVILFEQDEYPVTAISLENSRVYSLPRRKFYGLLEREEFRNEFIGNLMKKMRYLADQIRSLTLHDVEHRFFAFLEDRYGRMEIIDLALSKKAVAAAIGTTPETLSRLLLSLKKEGNLTWDGSKITINPDFWQEWEDN
jgi:CRP/FNR family transcriptional regulator